MAPSSRRRKEQLLADCPVPPTLFRGVMSRREDFAHPFVTALPNPESRTHSRTYLPSLLSDGERKHAASIADRSDRGRPVIPHFGGEVPGDHAPLIEERGRQVARDLGHPDAVLVFDPAAFPTQGAAAVGVPRQWAGRLGMVEHGQVGVFLGSVSDGDHARVDFRLSRPRGWAPDRKRRQRAGVPRDVKSRTRHERALEILPRRGGALPPSGVAGDDERGRPAWFRTRRAAAEERSLLAVPSNTGLRDLEAEPPPDGGRGRRPKVAFRGGRAWGETRPAGVWTRRTVRDGATGPREVEIVTRRGESKVDHRVVGFGETLVVVRFRDGGVLTHDSSRSHAARDTPRPELAWVIKASHRVEECLKRSQGEAGRDGDPVRNWLGWHHPRARSLIATWFLAVAARRGKKDRPGAESAAGADGPGVDPAPGQWRRLAEPGGTGADAPAGAERVDAVLSLQGA